MKLSAEEHKQGKLGKNKLAPALPTDSHHVLRYHALTDGSRGGNH